ncbi:serine hydrolase [Alteromonas sp. C1M14]|uniref:serine hydrolase domain-containing protein n=1 Tax=Alteromonas sp. C1M14 TaxID=2841567 RepID=UPI001C0A3EF0|nr:serine hydrolase [Alteromonas sp. C1M14]MBU2978235.1 beta-lactamase family protein [Alteromonas sp. C1M14]
MKNIEKKHDSIYQNMSNPIRNAYSGKLFPAEQVQAFSTMSSAFPTRRVKAGSLAREFPKVPLSLKDFTFCSNGNEHDIYDYISRNRITGLIVVQNGDIRFEHYDFGMTEASHWISMSMVKSISATLVGIAIKNGDIKGIDDYLIEYIPSLSNTSYEKVTIRQLLLMSSGVQWNEDHTNPESERRIVLEAQIAQKPGEILRFMTNLPRLHSPGRHWNYSTGETHLVGELIRAATGKWLSDYLSENLWKPLGMERDAYWWLESDDGLEVAGSGLNACLRDFARFGCFMANGGVIDNKKILPDGWCNEASGPTFMNGERVPYGFMWWSVPDSDGEFGSRAFSARGIFGQRIYVNPQQNVVIVTSAIRSKPMCDNAIEDNDFFNAMVACLEGNL